MHRRPACALVVPVVLSVGLSVEARSLALPRVGWPVLLAPAALVAAAWVAGLGKRWVAATVLLAGAPRLYMRHTLAPVVKVLHDHCAGVEDLVLLVGPGFQVAVPAVGRWTVVVTRGGLVHAACSGRLGPVAAAALVAQELGVVRVGRTAATWR